MPALRSRLAALISSPFIVVTSLLLQTIVLAQPTFIPKRLSVKNFDTGLYAIQRIAVSRDGSEVAFLGYNRPTGVSRQFGVSVVNIASRKVLARLNFTAVRLQILQGGIAFSPDDRTLVAGADTISIWDTKTWRPEGEIYGPFASGAYAAGSLLGVKFNQNGDKLIALYNQVWGPGDVQVANTSELGRLSDQARQAYRTGLEPRTFQCPEIQTFDLQTHSLLKRITPGGAGQRCDRMVMTNDLIVSPDGTTAFTGLIDWGGLPIPAYLDALPKVSIKQVDLKDGAVSTLVERRQDWIFSAFSIDSKGLEIATGEEAGDKITAAGGGWNINTDPIRLWTASGDRLIGSLGSSSNATRYLAFLPDSRHVLSCQTSTNKRGSLAMWDLQSRLPVAVFDFKKRAWSSPKCALAPDGTRAILTFETDEPFWGDHPDTAFVVGLPTSG